MLDRAKVDATLRGFFVRIVHVLMRIFVVLAELNHLGVKTTSRVAVLGAAGLAVGLAMQDSLSNFSAGVMIILFRPFQVGNFINAGGVERIVEEISIFHTHLRTPDKLKVIVPNSQINGGAIASFSAKDTRRCDMTVGVSYDDDLKVAKGVNWKVLNEDERILKEPKTIVGVMNFGESSVDIVVWPWVKASDFLNVNFHLNEVIKCELEAVGCSIPFPQRDVHLHSLVPKTPQGHRVCNAHDLGVIVDGRGVAGGAAQGGEVGGRGGVSWPAGRAGGRAVPPAGGGRIDACHSTQRLMDQPQLEKKPTTGVSSVAVDPDAQRAARHAPGPKVAGGKRQRARAWQWRGGQSSERADRLAQNR